MVQYPIIHWWFNIKSFINLSITLMSLTQKLMTLIMLKALTSDEKIQVLNTRSKGIS